MEGIMSKNSKNKKKIFSKVLTVICLGLFLYAGYGLFDILMDYYKNRQMMGDIQKTFYQATSDNQEESDNGKDGSNTVRTGFEPLLEMNQDRKSTRLNSSHVSISYAVFCLKKINRTYCQH